MSQHSSATSSPDRPGGVGAVIVAGGSGSRLRAALSGLRKQYADLLDEPVLAWSVRAFSEHPRIAQVVVVLPPEDLDLVARWLDRWRPTVIGGGAQRRDSVRNGLAVLSPGIEVVLVHDGARPLVSAALIDRLIDASAEGPIIPGLPATDTLKESDERGRIRRTIPRARVWHAQTPQAFPVALLNEAHRRAEAEGWMVTDDAELCERLGVAVRVVEGDPDNIKITVARDLDLARLIAAERRGRLDPAPLPQTGNEP